MKQRTTVFFYLILSVIGMMLLSTVILQAPVTVARLFFFEKLFLGSIFVFFCFIGVSLCLLPNWIKTIVFKKHTAQTNQDHEVKRCFIGHHPDCSVFDHHRITLWKKTWCTGCFGLLLGCIFASALMILYVLWFPFLTALAYRVLFFFGILCIILSYTELFIGSRFRLMHIVLNSLLVLSFFLITMSIGEHTGDVIDGFFTIVLCILWLDTRIMLSKYRHNLLCSNCPESCKTYP